MVLHALAFSIFFLSGFAGLIYQVIWQRLLVVFSGADVYSATVVVVAFMLGLGCGSLASGFIADRVSRATSLVLFAGAELGIGLFGLQSKIVLYDGLYERLGHHGANPAVMAALLVATLLLPTFLMGMSLPLLGRALTRSIDGAASELGWLYGCNTLGAACGALCAIWWFVPRHGLEGALLIAARFNFVCVVAAAPLLVILRLVTSPTSRTGRKTSRSGVDPAALVDRQSSPFSFRQWVVLCTLSGFLALSFEIAWFRLLGVMLKSTAFTFGTLLAQYLFWLAVGSLLGGVVAARIRRSALGYLTTQAAASLCAGLSLTLMLFRIARTPSLAWVRDYLGGYEPISVSPAASAVRSFLNDALWHQPMPETLPSEFLWLYFALPGFLIAPATLLMGFGFPLLQKVVQTDLAHLGRRVGALLVANIVGGAVGAVLTGWLLLTWLGTSGTLRFLVALSGIFPLVAVKLMGSSRRNRYSGFALAVAITAVVVTTLPGAGTLWARLHGTTVPSIAFAEDGSGLSLLKARGAEPRDGVEVYVNGLGQSRIPYPGGIQTMLGALPAMIHPHPREAAVVGLGSGNTLAALAGRKELQRIVSIEIIRPLLPTLRQSASRIGYSGLDAILEDPRIEHVFGDGRFFLKHSNRAFDILEADALREGSAYSGTLYSVEYFELVRTRLAPGGLAVTWVPTERVERTFLKVFPHVVSYDAVFIGSNEPIHIDHRAIEERLDDPETTRHYARLGLDIKALFRPVISTGTSPSRDGIDLNDVNTDTHPRDEFGIPAMFDLSMLRPEGAR